MGKKNIISPTWLIRVYNRGHFRFFLKIKLKPPLNTRLLMLWKINRIAGFYLTYHGVFWLVAGNCNSHCSRRVLQPLATTQSATVYINIHSAAIASARETRRNGWLFCLVVSIRLFSKKALRFMNACRAHKSCFFFFLKKGGDLKKKKKKKETLKSRDFILHLPHFNSRFSDLCIHDSRWSVFKVNRI